MTRAHQRKKQPDLVRRTLLESAEKLALEHGMSGVTVQAVAKAAGVTKGGLFHHFATKQALINGIFAHMIEQLDAEIDAAMARDPEPHGRFTRAYLETTFGDPRIGTGGPWTSICLAMIAEPSFRRNYTEWYMRRLEQHRETDDTPALTIVRLAADGAWMAHLMSDDGFPMPDLAEIWARLIVMTKGR